MSQDVLAQAQTGDPKAIERLMNHTTRSRGIRTRVASQDGYLHILFESDRSIDQAKMTTFVRQSLVQLRVEAVAAVMVYGRQQHQPHVNWTSKVLLDSEPAEDIPENSSRDSSEDTEDRAEAISDNLPIAPPPMAPEPTNPVTSSLSEPSEPQSEQFEATSDLEVSAIPQTEDYLAIEEPTQATATDYAVTDYVLPTLPPEAAQAPDDSDQNLTDQRFIPNDDANPPSMAADEPTAAERQDSEWDSLSRFDVMGTTDADVSLYIDDVAFTDVEFTSGNPEALTGAFGDLQGGQNPFQLPSPSSESDQLDTADVLSENGMEQTAEADEQDTEDSPDLDMDDDAAERNAAMEELLDNWDDDAVDQQQPDFEMPSDDELRAVLFPNGDLSEPSFLEAEDHGWGDLAIAPDAAPADASEGNEDLDDADLDDLLLANEIAAESQSMDEFDLDAFGGADDAEAEMGEEAIAESVWPEEATEAIDLDEALMFADQVDQSADNAWAELDEGQSEAADPDDLVFDDAAIADADEGADGGDRAFEDSLIEGLDQEDWSIEESLTEGLQSEDLIVEESVSEGLDLEDFMLEESSTDVDDLIVDESAEESLDSEDLVFEESEAEGFDLEDLMSEESTSEGLGTEELVFEESAIAGLEPDDLVFDEPLTETTDSVDLVFEEPLLEGLEPDDLVFEDSAGESLESEELVFEEPAAEGFDLEDLMSEDSASEGLETEELVFEESTSEGFDLEDLMSEESASEGFSAEELGFEDPTSESFDLDDLTSEESASEGFSAEELVFEDPALEDLDHESLVFDEPLVESADSDDLVFDEPESEGLDLEDFTPEASTSESFSAADFVFEDSAATEEDSTNLGLEASSAEYGDREDLGWEEAEFPGLEELDMATESSDETSDLEAFIFEEPGLDGLDDLDLAMDDPLGMPANDISTDAVDDWSADLDSPTMSSLISGETEDAIAFPNLTEMMDVDLDDEAFIRESSSESVASEGTVDEPLDRSQSFAESLGADQELGLDRATEAAIASDVDDVLAALDEMATSPVADVSDLDEWSELEAEFHESDPFADAALEGLDESAFDDDDTDRLESMLFGHEPDSFPEGDLWGDDNLGGDEVEDPASAHWEEAIATSNPAVERPEYEDDLDSMFLGGESPPDLTAAAAWDLYVDGDTGADSSPQDDLNVLLQAEAGTSEVEGEWDDRETASLSADAASFVSPAEPLGGAADVWPQADTVDEALDAWSIDAEDPEALGNLPLTDANSPMPDQDASQPLPFSDFPVDGINDTWVPRDDHPVEELLEPSAASSEEQPDFAETKLPSLADLPSPQAELLQQRAQIIESLGDAIAALASEDTTLDDGSDALSGSQSESFHTTESADLDDDDLNDDNLDDGDLDDDFGLPTSTEYDDLMSLGEAIAALPIYPPAEQGWPVTVNEPVGHLEHDDVSDRHDSAPENRMSVDEGVEGDDREAIAPEPQVQPKPPTASSSTWTPERPERPLWIEVSVPSRSVQPTSQQEPDAFDNVKLPKELAEPAADESPISVFNRPEAVVLLLFVTVLLLWQAYQSLISDAAPDGSLTARELARRLDVNPSTINRRKAQPDFPAWSQFLDPVGIAWIYTDGVFLPQLGGLHEPESSASL
ncbi:MAG TPA: hypothetical protein V6D20_23075 [Candidatus Obscuribacterales bacterium]